MDQFWRYKLDHVFFWTTTIVFHMFTRIHLIETAGFDQFALEIIIRNSLLAVIIYTNINILIPRYLFKRKGVVFLMWFLVSLAGYIVLKNLHDQYLHTVILNENGQRFFQYSYYNLSIALFYLAFGVALNLSKEWYVQREELRRIALEKITTELEYLKAQINPHFVFNSINTIYFQIDKENKTARDTLSVFSELLRYQLYECNGDKIPIEKEVNYLRNYVELQKLRRDQHDKISFYANDSLKGFEIAPLIIIPFVENAFKHVSHHSAGNEIKIDLDRRDDRFVLSVFNTRQSETSSDRNGGIGLKNVKRRLALLYPQQHMLDLRVEDKSYTVVLELIIDRNT